MEGDYAYPTISKVREIESLVREKGGFLHTYVDVFSTRDEFEAMFDHGLWKKMKARYDPDGLFPSVYDKIKPEIDPFSFAETGLPRDADGAPPG
jgi:FAD/FMN-containing dehydrogenase